MDRHAWRTGPTPPQVAGYRVEELVGTAARRGLAGARRGHRAGWWRSSCCATTGRRRARPAAPRGGCPRRPRSPHIVRLVTVVTTAHGLVLVLDFQGGGSLAALAAHPAEARAGRGGDHRGAARGRARRGARARRRPRRHQPGQPPVLGRWPAGALRPRCLAPGRTGRRRGGHGRLRRPARTRRCAVDPGVRRLRARRRLLRRADRPSALPRRRHRVGVRVPRTPRVPRCSSWRLTPLLHWLRRSSRRSRPMPRSARMRLGSLRRSSSPARRSRYDWRARRCPSPPSRLPMSGDSHRRRWRRRSPRAAGSVSTRRLGRVRLTPRRLVAAAAAPVAVAAAVWGGVAWARSSTDQGSGSAAWPVPVDPDRKLSHARSAERSRSVADNASAEPLATSPAAADVSRRPLPISPTAAAGRRQPTSRRGGRPYPGRVFA